MVGVIWRVSLVAVVLLWLSIPTTWAQSGTTWAKPGGVERSTDAPHSHSYDEATALGIISPIQQKLRWCTAPDPGYATAAEAEAHALDPPICQANPEDFTIVVGGLQSKPSPLLEATARARRNRSQSVSRPRQEDW
jgi:hypothetical protein